MTPARFNFARDVVEAQDPARLALRFCDREGAVEDITFGRVSERAARWADVLRSRGVAPGDRVLVLVGKTPAWHAVMLAALKVGAVAIPCSEMLRAKDLASSSFLPMQLYVLAAIIYFAMSYPLSLLLRRLESKLAIHQH